MLMVRNALIIFLFILITMAMVSYAAGPKAKAPAGKKTLLINNINVPGISDFSYSKKFGTITVGNFKEGPVISYDMFIIEGEIKAPASNEQLKSMLATSEPFLIEYDTTPKGKMVCTRLQNCKVISVSSEPVPGSKATAVYKFKAERVTVQ